MGCLGVFEVRITKPAGTPGGDVFVHDRIGTTVSWQCPAETARIVSYDKLGRWWEVACTFDPGNCATPVQSRTWGTIKSQYR